MLMLHKLFFRLLGLTRVPFSLAAEIGRIWLAKNKLLLPGANNV